MTDLAAHDIDQACDRHASEIGAASAANRYGAALDFLIADDQHIRHLRFFSFPDFEADLFIAEITLNAKSVLLEGRDHAG